MKNIICRNTALMLWYVYHCHKLSVVASSTYVAAVITDPTRITRRGPYPSIHRPTMGDSNPLTSNEIENPKLTAARDHPNSSSSGSMYSPNAQNETPLPTIIANTDPANSHHP